MKKIPISYFLHDNVVSIARSLLGKYLVTNINNIITGGIITETEAYNGIVDKASHSYNGIRTKRTEVMYGMGGVTYVYLCYGIHHILNIVTAKNDVPHAVLIRAIYPLIGTNTMLDRTGKTKVSYNITNGPGKLAKAMGINIGHNNVSIIGNNIWIEEDDIIINSKDIEIGPRIGVDFSGEDALLPYRFVLNYHNYIKKTL